MILLGVISFYLPEQLEKRLERLVRLHGYCSKSEAIRDAIRLLISEYGG